MDKLPFVTVVVPVFNAEHHIRKLIDALLKQTYPDWKYEIMLVDDGSTDKTLEVIGTFSDRKVKAFSQTNAGAYKSRNAGARRSRGDILAFIDADCMPDARWIEEAVSFMKNKKAEIVAGAVEMSFTDRESLFELYDSNFNLKQQYYVSRLQFATTANLFVRRKLFEKLQGFNDTLQSGGDYEFCHRAVHGGTQLLYCEEAKVVHPTRTRRSAILKKLARVTKGKAKVMPRASYFFPRPFGAYPEGFHIDLVRNLRKPRKLRFILLYYYFELIRAFYYLKASHSN